MRIVHVATLVTPDGAYGGPVRVALNQCKELQAAGHEVIFAAAARGFALPLPRYVDGVPVRLFPARQVLPRMGFAGVSSPGLLRWLWDETRQTDLVHVHLARDLVTLPAARVANARRVPFVLQTHGMIDPSARFLAKPLDMMLTRSVLRAAGKLFFLTPMERAGLESVAGDLENLAYLPNGTPVVAGGPRTPGANPREVLFLARLQARKRPVMFVQMAAGLIQEFPDVQFRLVGPDEGEGGAVTAAVAAAGLTDSIQWEGALPPEQTLERLKKATVYVLPSVDEPFPMSVLEAMSVSVPVVVSSSCGLSSVIADSCSGAVFDESLAGLKTAVKTLLSDPEKRHAAAVNAGNCIRAQFSMATIREQLETQYAAVVSAGQ